MNDVSKNLVEGASLAVRSSEDENQALEHPAMQELIEFRKVHASDWHLIKALSHCSKEAFLDYHNFFHFAGENLTARLQEEIDRDAPYREFVKIFLSLSQKYDCYACNHINRVFERINRGE